MPQAGWTAAGRWTPACSAATPTPTGRRRNTGVAPDRMCGSWRDLLLAERSRLDAVVVLTPTPKSLRIVRPVEGPAYRSSAKGAGVEPQRRRGPCSQYNPARNFLAVTFNYSGCPMVRANCASASAPDSSARSTSCISRCRRRASCAHRRLPAAPPPPPQLAPERRLHPDHLPRSRRPPATSHTSCAVRSRRPSTPSSTPIRNTKTLSTTSPMWLEYRHDLRTSG